MAVDVVPLGVPELGMTRAEILEYANTMREMSISMGEMFYTLLFAYVVAMYLAGSQLTRMQYAIANTMYLVVMAGTVFKLYVLQSVALLWVDYSGLENVDSSAEIWVYADAASAMILVALSLWFGRRIRHPKKE
ncbi:MAG: hypothetical protein H6985_18415 [Pseudomonadales bacterium]|nr:hypothetical protein [Pseudomonadales bacterium]